VAKEANGPLFRMLADSCSFHDAVCVETLRTGADIIGPLTRAGNGEPLVPKSDCSIEQLVRQQDKCNAELIKKLRVDEFEEELLEQTCKDAALHRMSVPMPLSEAALGGISVCQRFGVAQGACVSEKK